MKKKIKEIGKKQEERKKNKEIWKEETQKERKWDSSYKDFRTTSQLLFSVVNKRWLCLIITDY
jgi:hypothetical protein